MSITGITYIMAVLINPSLTGHFFLSLESNNDKDDRSSSEYCKALTLNKIFPHEHLQYHDINTHFFGLHWLYESAFKQPLNKSCVRKHTLI